MALQMTHIPVLEETVLQLLAPKAGETVLDVTLGLAGHATRFLEATGPTGRFYGLDADSTNLAFASKMLEQFGERVELHHLNFGQIGELALPPLDILFADLGLSSPHVDDPERGFTFRTEAPLDLRYDRTSGLSAAEYIERASEEQIAGIMRDYGELFQQAKRIGRELAGKSFATTTELCSVIEKVFTFKAKSLYPQIFQALRIAVNDELGVLNTLLSIGPTLLAPGGRMGVISFHSLEDRMVKHAFRTLSTPVKDCITGKVSQNAPFAILTPKAVVPEEEEIIANPRARSVKFRILQRSVE